MIVLIATSSGFAQMLGHPFMRTAFLAGTAIAVATGLVGYFVVLRAQVFSGDALSHVAFTGALGALAVGADMRVGLFAGCAAVGLLLGWFGERGAADDVVIGAVFTWVLGLGVLFLGIYTTSRATTNGAAGARVLFGSIFGISSAEARVAALVAAGIVGAVLFMARPLLFASVDADVAAARGVPVRALGTAFLALVGITAANATPTVGALLLLGLIAAPAGAAQRCTDRPTRGLVLSVVIAVGAMWIGLTFSYLVPRVPPSFAIVATATVAYAAASAVTARKGMHR